MMTNVLFFRNFSATDAYNDVTYFRLFVKFFALMWSVWPLVMAFWFQQ